LQTYLFYDIETTGLNKAFDQILHFAAVRTDLKLTVLERYDLKVRLNPDVVPSPAAMIVHRMKLSDIKQGLSEYEAIKKIHRWMNEPGTLSLGYNTLNFDDEFLRFSFFRNLLPPYTHQYANQCGRMDIYPITVMYFLFKASVLSWPMRNNEISLKLEDLNDTNKFVVGPAHHAMVDVEATIELTRALMKEEKMWDYLSENFNKKKEQERLAKIRDSALMVLGKFGSKQFFQSQVLYLGEHLHYKNQFLWLRLDDEDFSMANKDNILELAFVVRKKLGEPGFLLPAEERFMNHLSIERKELADANKRWLQENPEALAFLSEYHRNYKYPEMVGVDVDASLYLNSFWTPEEENISSAFHTADPSEKAMLVQKITNQNLQFLAIRLLGRHFPQMMSAKQADYFKEYMARIIHAVPSPIIDYQGKPRLTPSLALEHIKTLRQEASLDEEQFIILRELEEALQARKRALY
jgi:exodeoxyribonuclease-1